MLTVWQVFTKYTEQMMVLKLFLKKVKEQSTTDMATMATNPKPLFMVD